MGVANPFHEFVFLVRKMREAQVEYFKLKTKTKLDAAMQLERDVDQIIAAISRPTHAERRLGAIESMGGQ